MNRIWLSVAVLIGLIASASAFTPFFRGGGTTTPSLTGITLSNATFVCASGGTVGAITVQGTGSIGSAALSLTGTDAALFSLSSSTVPSNLTVGASPTGCPKTYSINIVATLGGATGSPFTQAESPVGSTGGGNVAFSLPSGSTQKFMNASGNDSCNGTSASLGSSGNCAWLTPNHAMNCGEVIVAAPGTYTAGAGFQSFGTVSNCPSTTGGIDGLGGIWFASMVCAGNVGTCIVSKGSNIGFAYNVQSSNWAIEGWMATTSTNLGAPAGFAANGNPTKVHHVIFVNDMAVSVGIGFSGQDDGTTHDVPGAAGFDYYANIGNIAQNAEQWTGCTAQIAGAGPATFTSITYSGTHIFFYGNFSYNTGSNGCGSDEEAFMFDTWDAHQFIAQSVMLNNLGWSAQRMGIQKFNQNFNSLTGGHDYFLQNTMFNANLANGAFGEINIQQSNNSSPSITVDSNVLLGTQSTSCALSVGGDVTFAPAWYANVVAGRTGVENVLFSTGGGQGHCYYDNYTGASDVNFTTNPTFSNTADLLTNRSGAPNCTTFINTTKCMGYDPATSTLTTLSPIGDLVPSCSNCGGKGYQLPSTTCVTSGNVSTYYPTWLKGVVYLQWNGSSLTENSDLVSKPCGL